MAEELFKEINQLLENVIKKLEDSPENSDLSKESVSELNQRLIIIKKLMMKYRFNIKRRRTFETYNPTIADDMKSILEVKEFQIGSYNLNTTTSMLTRFDKSIKLTRKELQLLTFLCSNNNVMVNQSDCLSVVWKAYNYKTARSMDVYMCRIRKYLKDDPSINILNIHGLGYRMTF